MVWNFPKILLYVLLFISTYGVYDYREILPNNPSQCKGFIGKYESCRKPTGLCNFIVINNAFQI